jgi:uncharacterized membrane protein YqjE
MMLAGPSTSRRALLRHLWAMVQTRTEAAALVVSLQKTAVMQGVALFAVAALAASAFITAVIVLIAVAVPPEWRVLALGVVVLALLLTAVLAAMAAGRRLRRDTALIADFSKGLRLDLAMINLALKDPETEDQEKLDAREKAKDAVREAAAEKASTPSTAEDGAISTTGPAMAAASAAMTAAAPSGAHIRPGVGPSAAAGIGAADRTGPAETLSADATDTAVARADAIPAGATEREMPEAPVTPPEAMVTPPIREHRTHGSA